MFCWQARGRFADVIETDGAGNDRLRHHLLACETSRVELDRLRRVSLVVSEAPAVRLRQVDAIAFEQAVLREGRARLAQHTARPAMQPPPLSPRSPRSPRSLRSLRPLHPMSLATAASVMIVAVALAHFLNGAAPLSERRQPVPDVADRVVGPRDIPFVVQEDLVGERRGRIPLTTYILEPAPDEKPVLRTSL